ncbi:MAG: penicillin-binding protein 2 [Gammaproteobacteria bacterium]|nr:penicillin-binding protein 2 [Gammaproteobacteria bacterium]
MPSPTKIKNHFLENRLFLNRVFIALIIGGILILLLIWRLIYLQVIAHEHFTTLANNNRIKISAVPPNRGLIYDRNGVLMATNLPAYRLQITPEQVKDMDTTLNALSGILEISTRDLKRFQRLRKRSHEFEAIPLLFNLTSQEVATFAVNRHRFPGVDVEAVLTRHYPQDKRSAHILGYVGRIDEREQQQLDAVNYRGTSHVGKTGIEKTYESLLHGKVGYRQTETTASGRVLRTLSTQPPEPGRDIYLSIDTVLQNVAEDAFNDYNGAAVAMDIESGEILAMVSMPTYNLNSFVNGISYQDYQTLTQNENQPLFNRALRGQYPPGSTLKPFIGLAGLELGITNEHSKTFCPGFYTLPNSRRKYRDWKRRGHGTVDITKAIAQSCDVYFYDLARSMGIDKIHDYLTLFGFGKKTGVDINGELPGLLPSREWKRRTKNKSWYPGETLISGIGQGFNLVTPIQLVTATATLARHGKHIRPSLVHATRGKGNAPLLLAQQPIGESIRIYNHKNWQRIIEAMTKVTHGAHGTARRIGRNAPYKMAAKTGTAQVFGLKAEEKYEAKKLAKKLHDHALFIAFAPVDKPRIAVAVIVEHGGSGGSVAGPIARKILDAYLIK